MSCYSLGSAWKQFGRRVGSCESEGVSHVWPESEAGRVNCRSQYAILLIELLEQALRQIEQLTEKEQDAAAGALLDCVKHVRDVD
jgi:hypothetical protein